MGFVLTVGFNSDYVMGYLSVVTVPFGWLGEFVGLILVTFILLYANVGIAKLHEFGGKRQSFWFDCNDNHIDQIIYGS